MEKTHPIISERWQNVKQDDTILNGYLMVFMT